MRPAEPTWDEIAVRYGLALRPQGRQLRGRCPLHGGQNSTAFVVEPSGGVFFCHACGQGGGLGTFVHLMEGGAGAGRDGRAPEGPRTHRLGPSPLELRRLARLRDALLQDLPEVEPVYPRDATHPYFVSRGAASSTVSALGGGVYAGPGPFHRRAVFPVWTPEGKLVGHIGRAIDPGVEPRYFCERGFRKSLLLFNERTDRRNDTLIVVEGIFDALAVIQAGFANVVALLGAVASPYQLAALSSPRHVVSLFDADDAGRRGATLLREVLGRNVTVCDLGNGDPGGARPDRIRSALAGVRKASVPLPTDGPPREAAHLTTRRPPCA
ncbi:MAG: toprim domain-containing protein [Thermoanaerobaculia bacterium]|nr:toprim domain-containing protein [Thermoanaerobaculia bacterium]